MQTTSHFIGLEIKSKLFSDLYVKLYEYLNNNRIEDIITFQNILSLHVTLYYFGKELMQSELNKIKRIINDIQKDIIITPQEFKYFEKENNKIIGYIYGNSNTNLELLFKKFHDEFNKTEIFENNLSFVPHFTLFRIKDTNKYDLHRENVERIINKELKKLENINLTTHKISLYKVNSNFPGEIQIKIS